MAFKMYAFVRPILLLALLSAAIIPRSSPGQELVRKGELTILSDKISYVTVRGTNAYVVTPADQLRIADVSDPASPKWMGSIQLTSMNFPTTRVLGQIALDGQYAYIPGQNSADFRFLFIVDISNPANPTLASAFPLPLGNLSEGRRGVSVSGGRAYVAAGSEGLLIIDISTPTAPKYLGRYSQGENIWDVEVSDGLAYVVYDGGLRIIEVTDPAAPWQIGAPPSNFTAARTLSLRDNYVYLGGNDSGGKISIFNVSNPTAPTSIFTTYAPGLQQAASEGVRSIISTTNMIFISVGNAGFYVWRPSLVPTDGSIVDTTSASDMAVAGNYAYLADSAGGLAIFDIQDPIRPKRTATLPSFHYAYSDPFPFSPHALNVEGNLVFIRDYYNGILIFDVSDPSAPKHISTYTPTYPASVGLGNIVASGNRAYVGTAGGFDVVDLSDPAKPTKMAGYRNASSTGLILDIALAGNYIYTTWTTPHNPGGDIVDISDPFQPRKVASFLPNLPEILDAKGGFLYAYGGSEGLSIYNIANPTSPARSYVVPAGWLRGLDYQDGYIYANFDNRSVILNAKNPNAISIATERALGFRAVSAAGSMLFESRITNGVGTLVLGDISVPTSPFPVDSEPLENIRDLKALGNRAYVVSQANHGTPLSLHIFEGSLGPVAPRPTLSAIRDEGKVIIRWSTNFPTLKLYSTTAFDQPWQLVTTSPYQEGSSFTFTNTRPVASTLFYRLFDQ